MTGIKINRVDDGQLSFANYREFDLSKFNDLLIQMNENYKKINKNYKYTIEVKDVDNGLYHGLERWEMKQYTVHQKILDVDSVIKFDVPKIINDSIFYLNGTTFIPIPLLNKLPIDRNKENVFITLNGYAQIKIKKDIIKKGKDRYLIFFEAANKTILLQDVAPILYKNNQEEYEKLIEEEIIERKEITDKTEKQLANLIGFHSYKFFNDYDIVDFINEIFILPYYQDMLKHIYGTSELSKLITIAINRIEKDIILPLCDMNNRRVDFMDRLFEPVFASYHKSIRDMAEVNTVSGILPKSAQSTIVSIGFRKHLKGKQLFDISISNASRFIYKASQMLYGSDRIPITWSELDETQYGVIDPIAFSASNLGGVVSFTSDTRLNQYGQIILKDK